MIDSWEQHNQRFVRPHKVLINPYDPEKHVWLVDDGAQPDLQVHERRQEARDDRSASSRCRATTTTHFARPTDIAWLPDGTFFVSDGYTNTRVVKFDKNGKFLMTWGQKGTPPNETRPGYMNTVHSIADRRQAPRVRRRPRQLAHPGLRRERQVPRRVAERQASVLHHDVAGPAPVGRGRHHAEVPRSST